MKFICLGYIEPGKFEGTTEDERHSRINIRKWTPVDEYLMERNAEILLARSAAPDSISSDETLGLSEAALFHQKALR